MANSVVLEVILEGKNLKVVQREVDNVTGAVNDNTAAQNKNTSSTNQGTKAKGAYNKQEKGVGQLTSNSTKAFSKQAQGISGGLVPAYAVLASNIFAIGAAFLALKNNAQIDQLTQGLVQLGKASGLAMGQLSVGLREATGSAISFEESMRSVALITSAGLDPSAIARFGKVAKDASIALGRDLGDSMNRLTRGVTKLEPELLDELGIMVRLDEATENYASELGKSASSLTNFEKRQGFMNAVLDEGERKFGALGDSVSINPYDQLGAAFSNLSKIVISFVSGPIGVLAKFLASSPVGLLTVLTLFGATVIKTIAPSLGDLAKRADAFAIKSAEMATQSAKSIVGMKGASGAVQKYQQALAKGEPTEKLFGSAMTGSNISLRKRKAALNRAQEAQKKAFAASGKYAINLGIETDAVRTARLALKEKQLVHNELIKTQHLSQLQTERNTEAEAVATITTGNLKEGMKAATANIVARIAATRAAAAQTAGLATIEVIATGTTAALGAAATFTGAALARIAPWVTAIMIAFSILAPVVSYIMDLFTSDAQERFNKKQEEMHELLKESAVNLKEVDKALAGKQSTIRGTGATYLALNNILNTYIGKLKEVEAAEVGNSKKGQLESIRELLSSSKALNDAFEAEKTKLESVEGALKTKDMTEAQAVERAKQILNSIKKNTTALASLDAASKESNKTFSDFMLKGKVSTYIDEVADSFTEMQKSVDSASDKMAAGRVILENLSAKQLNFYGIDPNLKTQLQDNAKLIEETQQKITEKVAQEDEARRKGGVFGLKRHREEVAALEAELQGLVNIQNTMGEGVAETFRIEGEKVKVLQFEAITRKTTLAGLKQQLSFSRAVKGESLSRLTAELALEGEIRKETIKNIQVRAGLAEKKIALAKTDDERLAAQNEMNQLTQEMAAIMKEGLTATAEQLFLLEEKKLKVIQQQQKFTKMGLDVQQKSIGLDNAALDIAIRQKRIDAQTESEAAGRGFVVSAVQEEDIQKSIAEDRKTALEAEEGIKAQMINMEYALLKQKLHVAAIEAQTINASLKKDDPDRIDLTAIRTAQGQIESMQKRALENNEASYSAARAEVDLESAKRTKAADTERALQASQDALALGEFKNSIAQRGFDLEGKANAVAKSSMDSKRKLLEQEAKLRNLTDPNIREAKLTAQNVADIEKEMMSQKIVNMVKEANLKIQMIEAEYDLILLKNKLAKEEAILKATELNKSLAPEDQVDIEGIKQTFTTLDGLIQSTKKSATGAISDGLVASVAEANTTLATIGQKGSDAARGQTTTPTGIQSALSESKGTLTDGDASTGDKIGAMTNIASGFAADLAAIGPEAPLLQAIVAAADMVSDAWNNVGDVFARTGEEAATGMEKGAAIAGALASTFGAMAQISSAASKEKIAGIDAEINAEKKRDGKSKESLAKIQQLEKRKEAAKKKEFETNKKMQMAQTIASTAAGIMGVLSGIKDPFVSAPLAFAQAAIIGAMGVAQLAVIAGTSFQGGGSSGGDVASLPSISVGKQTTKTDLATSAGAAGELGYFRGESGSGGPENFKPAFMGAKYRAAGGPTAGYVVGEQGPELFVPETPGKIMPNDQMKQSAPVNANISISALDASGVEEILVAQRGNIIGMLREAVNSYGEDFYEDIDTAVYTPSSAGAGKY